MGRLLLKHWVFVLCDTVRGQKQKNRGQVSKTSAALSVSNIVSVLAFFLWSFISLKIFCSGIWQT